MAPIKIVTESVGEKNGQNRENRIRRLARSRGYVICKSRARKYLHGNDRGAYMLMNVRNIVVLGERFDVSLDDIAAFLDRSHAA